MRNKIFEALSKQAETLFKQLQERDPYSPFIDFFNTIRENNNFNANTINMQHITALQDLVANNTINLSEPWLINNKLFEGDYARGNAFKYLIYVLDVMYDNDKFRKYYSDLPREEANKLKAEVQQIPRYDELQNLIQKADAQQKKLSKGANKTPSLSQIWDTAKSDYENINEGDDTPVEAAIVIGNIIQRFGKEEFQNGINQFLTDEKLKNVINSMIGIYNSLSQVANKSKNLSEEQYRDIISQYNKPEFSQKPYNNIVYAIAKKPPRNVQKLVGQIADIININPDNPDDVKSTSKPNISTQRNGPDRSLR